VINPTTFDPYTKYDPKRYDKVKFMRRSRKWHLVLYEWPHHFSISCGIMYGKIKHEEPGETSTYIVGCEDLEEWLQAHEWFICKNCMRTYMYQNEIRSALQHAERKSFGHKKSAP
jgi:hypothetical protein